VMRASASISERPRADLPLCAVTTIMVMPWSLG
jgi:hypothetical protein